MKRLTGLIIAACLTVGTCVPTFANEKLPETNINSEIEASSEAAPRSTLSFYGPLAGAVQKGSPKKSNSAKNLTNASIAAAFLANVSGCPVAKYLTDSGLALALLANNSENQYYIRTQYFSSDGTMYYYKYDYYKNSNYTGKVGTDYSFCYSTLY